MLLRALAFLACLAIAALAPAFAQQTQITPDCDIPFTFTGAGQVTPNTTCGANLIGVYDWQLVYFVDGFSAISLTVQSAPDNNNVPGTWVPFAGTIVNGVNPNTATTQASTRLQGYFRWNRIILSAATGTGSVRGHLYGCRAPGCSTAGAVVIPPGVLPGGLNCAVQFNLAGTFGGDATNFCWDNALKNLALGGGLTVVRDVQMRADKSTGYVFAMMPAASNGTSFYCSDCAVTSGINNTAAAAGPGCYVTDLSGVHKCTGY